MAQLELLTYFHLHGKAESGYQLVTYFSTTLVARLSKLVISGAKLS